MMVGQHKYFAVLKYNSKLIFRQDKQLFIVKCHRSGFGNLNLLCMNSGHFTTNSAL